MKKLFLSVFVVLCFISCNKNQSVIDKEKDINIEDISVDAMVLDTMPVGAYNADNNKIDSSAIKKQEAINVLNEMDGWVRKGVKNQLSNIEVNKKIKPLAKKYDILLSQLNKKDSIFVQAYKIKQINKMIDLQMQQ